MYYDLLVKIKNAGQARKKMVRAPFSNLDFAISKILVSRGYLKDAKKKAIDKKQFLELELLGPKSEQSLRGLKFFSTPGRRMYVGYQELKSVKQGHGFAVVSTSKGVMTNSEARRNKLGGEYLFEIW